MTGTKQLAEHKVINAYANVLHHIAFGNAEQAGLWAVEAVRWARKLQGGAR